MHTPIGSHGGASRLRKAERLGARTRGDARASAAAAPSTSRSPTARTTWRSPARLLGVPEANMHDYEYAVTQHRIGCRLAQAGDVPRLGALRAPAPFRRGRGEVLPLPGAEGGVLPLRLRARPRGARRGSASTPSASSSSSARRPTSRFTTASRTRSSPKCCSASAPTRACTRSCCRAPQAQRELVGSLALPSLILPPGAVEAQSLVALADLVVSAGGTMNREAAALGTPVYTTYGGRLGGVDEALIRSGRLRPLTDPRAIELREAHRRGNPDQARPRFSRRDRSSVPSEPTIPRRATSRLTLSLCTPGRRGRAGALHRACRRRRGAPGRHGPARPRRPDLRRRS